MSPHLSSFVRRLTRPATKAIAYCSKKLDYLRHRNSMVPPRSMDFVGGMDFEKIGNDFKAYFIELAGLQPNHRVLDVGSGIGRMAIPLTSYLSEEGSYAGIEIVRKGVSWCQNRITPKFPNFQFQQLDVFNKLYNPKGKCLAKDYRFPFEDESFDFVFLTSVFTHMLLPDVNNYLKEISRVLKPGGKCFITFFILNKESKELTASGRSAFDFKFELDGCMTSRQDMPERAIAFEETTVNGLFKSHDLKIMEPIRYGSWCGRENYFSYQDVVLAEKIGKR